MEIWVTNVLTIPRQLVHLGLHPTTSSSLVGIIIILTFLCVLMGTNATSLLKIGVSVAFFIGFTVHFVLFAWLRVVGVLCS